MTDFALLLFHLCLPRICYQSTLGSLYLTTGEPAKAVAVLRHAAAATKATGGSDLTLLNA